MHVKSKTSIHDTVFGLGNFFHVIVNAKNQRHDAMHFVFNSIQFFFFALDFTKTLNRKFCFRLTLFYHV